jgi:hypothetical protein
MHLSHLSRMQTQNNRVKTMAPSSRQDHDMKWAKHNLKQLSPAPIDEPAPNRTEPLSTDLKEILTLKELRFIELYLTGGLTVDKAMKSAGYVGYHPNSLYRIARKIVQKYEHQAGDHRKIMRDMGYGVTKLIELLIDSAKNAKSETVRLNARIALAKCLGLTKEIINGVQGVKIVFDIQEA